MQNKINHAKEVHGVLFLAMLSIYTLLTFGRSISSHIFLDGFTMASISRNLAIGKGTFWNLHYTANITPFISHPPFGIWLESIFFKIMGDHLWVESTFGFFLGFCGLILIHFIWKKLNEIGNTRPDDNTTGSWWVIFLTLCSPIVVWCINNNMLENTVLVLVLLNVYLVLAAMESSGKLRFLIFSFLSGLALYLGIMTKGPPVLFPIILPVLLFFIIKKYNFKRCFSLFFIILLSMFLLYVFTYLTGGDQFRLFLSGYIQNQLFPSIRGDLEVAPDRLLILKELFFQLLSGLIVVLLLRILLRKKIAKTEKQFKDWSLVFLILGFAGSLPFLLFSKQMKWYLMPSMPFFSIGLGLITIPIAAQLEKLLFSKTGAAHLLVLRILTSLIFGISIFGGIVFRGSIDVEPHIIIRDLINQRIGKKVIDEVYSEYAWRNFNIDIVRSDLDLPFESEIAIQNNLHDNWRMIAYFQRVYRASLVVKRDSEFFLNGNIIENHNTPSNYEQINRNERIYSIYKRK